MILLKALVYLNPPSVNKNCSYLKLELAYLLNASFCLEFLVFEGPKMKVRSGCRERLETGCGFRVPEAV